MTRLALILFLAVLTGCVGTSHREGFTEVHYVWR